MADKVVQLNRSYAVYGSTMTVLGIDYPVDKELQITVPDTVSDEDLATAIGPALANPTAQVIPIPTLPEAMTLVLDSAAPNADLTLTAKTKGVLALVPTIKLHNAGGDNAGGVVVTDRDIVVTLPTTGGTSTATANSVKAQIDGDEDAAALVSVAVEGSGAGLVDAVEAATPLTGGVNGTPGVGGDELFAEDGNKYLCTGANEWVKFTTEPVA